MRGLAEFIMRGRWQALGIAVLGSGSLLFGWISAAAIALVTLRNGTASGGWLVLWALLPAVIITAMTGDTGSAMLLLGGYGLAVVLRESVSLSLAVMASVPLALVSGLTLTLLNGPFLEDLVATFNQALAQLEQDLQQEGSGELAFNSLAVPQVAALLATGNAVIALLSLMLGRYWQAALYNPGGFGDEFRALKLPAGCRDGDGVRGRRIVVDGARLAGLECCRGAAAHHRRVRIGTCLCSPLEQRGRMVDPDVRAVDRARYSEVGMGGMCRDRRIY